MTIYRKSNQAEDWWNSTTVGFRKVKNTIELKHEETNT